MKRIALVFLSFAVFGCTLANPNYFECDGADCKDSGADTMIVASDNLLLLDRIGLNPKLDIEFVYSDKDGDGHPSDKDCDDNDPMVYPGADEICNGVDDDCDGQIDNNLTDIGDPCGSKVGECKQGTLKCVDKELICDGTDLVLPQNELCDGKDNDCDGKTDEDWPNLGKVCEVGKGACIASGYYICNGSATKLACSAAPGTPSTEGPPGNLTCYDGIDNDCDGLGDLLDPNCVSCGKDADCNDQNKCTSDSCVGGVCKNIAVNDGTLCSDGLYCNGIESCKSGKCGAGPKVLCDDSDACTTDSCSESLDKCVYMAVTPGSSEGAPGSTACLDGKDNDCDGKTDLADSDCVQCQKDTDCTDKGLCVNRVCNSKKVCVYSNKTDGTSCSNGKYCDGAETCKTGTCQTGTAIKCDDSDICTTDACNESLDKCVYTAISNCKSCASASDCDDSNSCTTDSCSSGKCVNTKLANGATCNDNAYCTTTDTCSNGTCVGTSRDCSVADKCKTGYCDESSDSCKTNSKADGTSCSDGLYCNGYESCKSGLCSSGTSVSCMSSDVCKVGSCDETQDKCAYANNPNPGAESWALSGTCADGKDNDCDGLKDYADSDCRQCQYNSDCNDNEYCTQDTCNTSTWKCQNTALTGNTCNDGKWCTVNDKCASSGTCGGTSRDCSSYSDQCNAGTCDESSQTCKLSYKPSTTLCNDNKYCTIGDYCIYGQCVSGGARNCGSGYVCNETQNQCLANGSTGCADGTREGFTDKTSFPNIAGCSGTWSSPGLTNGAYLCASGWHICQNNSDVMQNLPSGKTCWDVWSGSDKRFFATLQPSQGNGYCNTTGTNDIFGCGNYGDPPTVGSCGTLNKFSSEDCNAISYIGSTPVWKCGGAGDSSDELTTVVKLSSLGGGILCCKL